MTKSFFLENQSFLTPQVASPVFVKEYHVMFMCWSFNDLLDVNSVSQVIDVLLISSDVKDRCQRLGQLDRKNFFLWTQLHGSINTASIASVVASIGSIQDNLQLSFVIVTYSDSDVDMCHVSIIQSAECKVSMQELRMNVEFEMLVAESKATERQHHRLDDATCSGTNEVVTSLLF
jgi:hypothetical protein